MSSPMSSNSGSHASKTARSPPTMIESVAFRAPEAPPLTGAPRTSTPRSASRSATPFVVPGVDVVRSTRTDPSRRPSSIAPTTASTFSGPGSERKTT